MTDVNLSADEGAIILTRPELAQTIRDRCEVSGFTADNLALDILSAVRDMLAQQTAELQLELDVARALHAAAIENIMGLNAKLADARNRMGLARDMPEQTELASKRAVLGALPDYEPYAAERGQKGTNK